MSQSCEHTAHLYHDKEEMFSKRSWINNSTLRAVQQYTFVRYQRVETGEGAKHYRTTQQPRYHYISFQLLAHEYRRSFFFILWVTDSFTQRWYIDPWSEQIATEGHLSKLAPAKPTRFEDGLKFVEQ
jgi:hypothetical protein